MLTRQQIRYHTDARFRRKYNAACWRRRKSHLAKWNAYRRRWRKRRTAEQKAREAEYNRRWHRRKQAQKLASSIN